MSADVRINVVDIKLSVSVSVEGPGAVVADDLLAVLRDLGGLCRSLGWLGGSVGGPGTDILHPVSRPVALLERRVEGCAAWTGVTLRRSVGTCQQYLLQHYLYVPTSLAISHAPEVPLRTVVWVYVEQLVLAVLLCGLTVTKQRSTLFKDFNSFHLRPEDRSKVKIKPCRNIMKVLLVLIRTTLLIFYLNFHSGR